MAKDNTGWRAQPGTARGKAKDFVKECPHCDRIFKNKSDAARHLATHDPTKWDACLECGKKFTQRSALSTHMNTHLGHKPHQCGMGCSARFADPSSRGRHERDVHDPSFFHKCSKCGDVIKRREQFVKHFQTCFSRRPTKQECDDALKTHRDAYMEEVRVGKVAPIPKKVRKNKRGGAGSPQPESNASVSLIPASAPLGTDIDGQCLAAGPADPHDSNSEVADSGDDLNQGFAEPDYPSYLGGVFDPPYPPNHNAHPFVSPSPPPSEASDSSADSTLVRKRPFASDLMMAVLDDPCRLRSMAWVQPSTESANRAPTNVFLEQNTAYPTAQPAHLMALQPIHPALFSAMQNGLGSGFAPMGQGAFNPGQPASHMGNRSTQPRDYRFTPYPRDPSTWGAAQRSSYPG